MDFFERRKEKERKKAGRKKRKKRKEGKGREEKKEKERKENETKRKERKMKWKKKNKKKKRKEKKKANLSFCPHKDHMRHRAQLFIQQTDVVATGIHLQGKTTTLKKQKVWIRQT